MKVTLVDPEPVEKDVWIDLTSAEALSLQTLLSAITDTGYEESSGPINKLVRQLWEKLDSAGVPFNPNHIFDQREQPRLKESA